MIKLMNDSSELRSSSNEEDLDLVFFEDMFPVEKLNDKPLINLQDLRDRQCEKMFRQAFQLFLMILESKAFLF